MAQPGWYPDPAGTPHRFRYWDGQAWSADVTDDPAAAGTPGRPGRTGRGGTDGRPPRRRWGPLVLALTAVLVLVLAGVLVVRGLLADRPVADPGPLPSSTVSGWDDSSPEPTPTPSGPAEPTPTPTPPPPSEQPVQPCPQGQPAARQDHPADGRVHGGGLSFPEVRGWKDLAGVSTYSWAYDVAGQTKQLEPRWIAGVTVGALFTGDGFDEPRRSAELVMQCVITSGFYPELSGREDVWSKAVTVDGRPGWSIRSEVRVDDPDIEADGDTVEVIIVDTDSPESLAMFIGAVTIDDEDLQQTLDTTIEGLRVD